MWTDGTPEAIAGRALVFVVIMACAYLLAAAAWGGLGRAARNADRATRRLFGRPRSAPDWDRGSWACGRCRSVNRATTVACERCRAPRADVEIPVVPVATEPDVVPAEIAVPDGSAVTLEHNAAAHDDGLNGHWRLRVNGVILGSAARRDGALALLRAVRGSEVVMFDPKGAGYAAYGRAALIAAFEARSLPLRAPCPERKASPR
jgi:hypothetical protein